jgi:hypothetical protein
MEYIWEINDKERTGIISRDAQQYLHDLGEAELMKSRASVIFFLNDMVEEGVLEFETAIGKGARAVL